MNNKSALVWLSFADGLKPEGSQFLGVAIVKADTLAAAVRDTWERGINPGGEVMGFHVPERAADTLGEADIGRLLTKDEANALTARIDAAMFADARAEV